MRPSVCLKLLAGLAMISLAGCQCGPAEPALAVTITVDADVPASCVVFEVSAGGTVRLTQELKRPAGKNTFKVGMKKLQLPTDVRLIARSYTSSAAAGGCAEPKLLTSASAPVDAKFPAADVGTASLGIHLPGMDLDGDRDGHVAVGKGGDDCDDAAASVHPGLPAACASTVDNDCDGKAGCADTECATSVVCNMPPTALVFVTTAAPVNVNACSPALTVETQGAGGQAVNAAVDTPIALSAIPPAGVTLYSDFGCTTAVTQLTLAAGQSRATFHFKAAAPGSFSATATLLGLPTASQAQSVVQPAVTQLKFTNPVRTVAAGDCSAALTLQTQDAAGMPAPMAAAGSVVLSSNQAGVGLFSDAACTAALTNSALPLASGATSGTFYARPTSTLPTTLTATLAGIPPATQVLTVTAGAPTQLAFATAAQGVQSGACSNVVTVETRDLGGNPAAVTAATAVTLTLSGVAATLYSDATCATAIAAPLPLSAGSASVSFYFKGSVPGMATVTASATGLTSAMQTESIGVGPPAKLAFTSGAQTTTANQCSAAVTVQVQDANGNPSNVTGAALAVTVAGPATMFGLFTDASCTTAVSAPLSIAVGGTTATFYFRGTKAGPAVVTADSAPLTGAMQTQTVNAAAPMALVFTSAAQSQPAGTCAQFDLEARDAFGNPSAPTAAVMVALTSAPAVTFGPAGCGSSVASVALSGTTVSFFATTNVAGAKVLTATAPFAAAMQTYTVNAGAATRLGFVVQPASAVAGAAIVPAVQVAVQDAFGNTVTSSTVTVTVALGANPGAGTLSGTAGVAAVAGVAVFPGLSIDKAGTGYTLGASSGSTLTAATSTAFDISAGPPAAVAFTVQPTSAVAAAGLAPAVQVTLRDANGNTVTTSTANVTVAIANNAGGGTLSGTATVAAVAGVATFPGLSINKTGTGYTLSATSGALPVATSAAFDITPGALAQVAFGVQPTNATAGASLTPAVQVRLEDAQGNLTASTANVTLAIGANPGTAVLSGTATVAGVAGLATFSNLSLDKSGTGYTLTATSGALPPATSAAFNISAGAPAALAFVTQPGPTVAGAVIDPGPTVAIVDALGNRVLTSTANVTLAIGTNPGGGALSGTATVAAVAGLASFAGLSINKTGTGYTLNATSVVTGTTSSAFNITPGAAASLSFTVQPTTAVSTASISPAVQVTLLDANLNVVTTSTANITLAIGTNPGSGVLSGTLTVAAVAGVATFPGLSIDKIGTGYTLSATSGLLPAATSGAFNITLGPPNRLTILGTPLTVPALGCSAARIVELQDAGGNTVTSTGNTVLNAYTAAPAGPAVQFFSDAACTVAQAAGTRTIGNGLSQVTFFFKATNAAVTVTLTASAATVPVPGTQDATITQAIPTDLAFTTAPPTVEAGFCQALTLERQDALGRPTSPAFATTVSLGSLPAAGISFFSNNTCTAALAVGGFDILSGSSSTVIYAKGISGSLAGVVPGSQVYDLTASSTVPAALNAGTLGVTVLPMVRRRSAACTLGAATIPCAITPTLADISRTILIYQATPGGGDDNPSDDNVSCHLDPNGGVARVVCDRVGTGGNVDIEWQTVSFPYSYANGGVTVDHVSGGCLGTSLLAMPIDVTVSNAPIAERFVLFGSTSLGADNDGADFFTAKLTGPTTLRVSQSDPLTTCNTTMGFQAQVVSWAGATVNRPVVTLGGAGATFTASQATVPSSPTFLLYSSRMTGDVGGNNNICRRRLRGDITDATTLTFDRPNTGACTGANVQEIAWEHVQLPPGATVQRVVGAMVNTSGSAAPTFTTAVDLTRSFAFIGGQGQGGSASGRTDYTAADQVGSALARTRLTANNTLTFTRTATNGAADWIGWVVQLTP